MATLTREQFDALAVLKCVVSYNRYGGYCVPLSSHHRPAAQAILAGDVYEPDTIDYLMSNCADGDIVHAGTYFGDFLPALSQACSPGAKIWAFEPNSENYRCAKITALINDISNVELRHAGLGERNEKLTLSVTDEKGQSRGGSSRIVIDCSGETSEGTETVQMLTIDELIPADRSVSIIQLDVEGHEQQALSGAIETIKRCSPILVLEVLPGSSFIRSDWFSDKLLRLGYKMLRKLHGNAVFVCNTNTPDQEH
jgi:FkbM family methyltransferase